MKKPGTQANGVRVAEQLEPVAVKDERAKTPDL